MSREGGPKPPMEEGDGMESQEKETFEGLISELRIAAGPLNPGKLDNDKFKEVTIAKSAMFDRINRLSGEDQEGRRNTLLLIRQDLDDYKPQDELDERTLERAKAALEQLVTSNSES